VRAHHGDRLRQTIFIDEESRRVRFRDAMVVATQMLESMITAPVPTPRRGNAERRSATAMAELHAPTLCIALLDGGKLFGAKRLVSTPLKRFGPSSPSGRKHAGENQIVSVTVVAWPTKAELALDQFTHSHPGKSYSP
jgi:hypothetical protein